MTYEIRKEGNKYNIYYAGGPFDGLKEFHSTDGVNGTVREGYKNANAPNWNGLTQALWGSSLMAFAVQKAMPNGFTLLTKVLTDGEIGSASENSFVVALGLCFPQGWPHQLSTEQKAEINTMLEANNFTIKIDL